MFIDIFVDYARHGRAQARQVGAAVALRDVIRKAQHLFIVGIVPLHRHVDRDVRALVRQALARGLENGRVQDRFGFVDVLDETARTAFEGEDFFLARALVGQFDLDAIVQEGQFADALGQDFVVEFHVRENLFVSPEMHVGAALVRFADDLDRGGGDVADHDDLAVLRHAAHEFHVMHFAIAADGQFQQFRQAIHAGHAHAVQTARDFIRVLVELAARVQLGHDDFRRRTLRIVLVVHFQAGRHAAAIVGDRDRIVAVDGDVDIRAVAGQRFIDGVVQHFEYQMVQAGAVRGVANVHARAFAHGFQAFQDLDGGGAVFFRFGLDRGVLWILGHGLLSQITIADFGVRPVGSDPSFMLRLRLKSASA